jgi:O-antigen biosynthesis protein
MMRICFVIGSPDISGGTYVIFQHALFLKKELQCIVDIVPMFPVTEDNTRWHPEARLHLNFLTFEEAQAVTYDIAIATWWKTVLEIHMIRAERYVYFVQSIESWFYPPAEVPLRKLVDSTYTHGLPVITEAAWIKRYLYENYSSRAWLVRNGIRKDIYKPYGDRIESSRENGLRVLVEGPVDVGFKNVPRTIALSRKSRADEIWLLTSSNVQAYDGVRRVFSRVPITKVPAIYRSCDVIVKLSYVEGMFGPPLEMFHCGGTAIVYNVTGHDEYIRHNINGLVAKKDDENAVVDYLNMLRSDSEKLKEMKQEAQRTAFNWPGWNASSAAFFKALGEIAISVPRPDYESLFAAIKQQFAEYVNEEEKRKRTIVPA